MTISDTSLPAVTEHPAVAGSKYVGCYRDSASRALKNASITTPIPGGMTNEICIKFCLGRGFSLAATEYGFECYCGEVLEDSWLMGDSDCNKPCPGDATCNCGGSWAMSLWNADDGEVPKAFGPQEHFVAPPLLPGETDVHVYAGGLRQTVVLVTTPVYEWPAESPSPSSSSSSSYASDIDIAALAANIHAIVSAAMKQAQGLAMSEVARAKSMGRLPERVAKAIDSTTITTCSATTTLTTTVICTESTGSSVVSNSLTPLV
ncbi:WSC domain-containing protein, partial [Cercophora samala]